MKLTVYGDADRVLGEFALTHGATIDSDIVVDETERIALELEGIQAENTYRLSVGDMKGVFNMSRSRRGDPRITWDTDPEHHGPPLDAARGIVPLAGPRFWCQGGT